MRAALAMSVLVVVCGSASPPRGAPRANMPPPSGAWTATNPPIHIRAGHTATLLGDGTVLVAGGDAEGDTTEIYDPVSARFTSGPKMIAKRSNHTATMLLSGKVLLCGGKPAGAACELYDPSARSFTATGSMTMPRAAHSAVRLRSGKVLVVGDAANPPTDLTSEIYDPATGTFTATQPRVAAAGQGALALLPSGQAFFLASGGNPEQFDPSTGAWTAIPAAPMYGGSAGRSATLMQDGNILVTSTVACMSAGGPVNCDTYAEMFFPSGNGGVGSFGAQTGPFQNGAGGMSATLLPNGQVLFTGGIVAQNVALVWDPGTRLVWSDGALAAAHSGQTATLLPGGDVLVLGGDQAAAELRIPFGAFTPTSTPMVKGRAGAGAVTLRTGYVLIAGGTTIVPGDYLASAELYDPAAAAFSATGSMGTPRVRPELTMLASGKVLVTGGASDSMTTLASAEIYDATLGAFHAAAGDMTIARTQHAAALLPSGKVLVTGGCSSAASEEGCAAGATLDSAELFDPASETFQAAASMVAPHRLHGMVRMPNGRYLVVGGATAEIFDPNTGKFRATASPGASRDGRTARLLPNGKVFVSGGPTLSNDLFDPDTETWSFSGPLPLSADHVQWRAAPHGELLSSGGTFFENANPQVTVFDPFAVGVQASIAYRSSNPRWDHVTTSLSTSGVLVAGGNPCFAICVGQALATGFVWTDGAPEALRPAITNVPDRAAGGQTITIGGLGFADRAEGSSGESSSSAGNAPVAVWVTESGQAVVPGRVLSFTDTSLTWVAPVTGLYGHGRLFVFVGGVASHGAPLEIIPAPQSTACTSDSQCQSGFCTDGFCCDQRCDGVCQACSSAKRGGGTIDGVCGAVPKGTGQCFSLQGQPCTADKECATGFCVENICCNAPCSGTCLSCTQPNLVGVCSAIAQGACDVACDGDHTLKKVGQPDVDCAPFKCDGKTCRTTCASARDCVPPSVCGLDGLCVAPVNAAPSSETAWGCAVRRGDRAPWWPIGIAFAALARYRRRCRR